MTMSFEAQLIAYWQAVYVHTRGIRYVIDFSTVVKKDFASFNGLLKCCI